MPHNTVNPNGLSALTYAWIAPFIGALIRPVGGWVSDKFGEQIKAATPEYAMLGFAVFYLVCVLLNWWFYLRKQGEFYNP